MQRVPLGHGPDESVTQKRRCRRVHESISPTLKRPVPVVLDPGVGTDWQFDLGEGLRTWEWSEAPDVTALRRTRTPKAKAGSVHVPVFAFSTTTKTHLHLESGLEHDLVRDLDRRTDVTWVVPQPLMLSLPATRRGRRLEHTPDLLTRHDDGSVCVWDARPEAKRDEVFDVKAGLTEKACREVGWQYGLFSGLPPVRRINLIWLGAYRRDMPWYPGSLARILDVLGPRHAIGDVVTLDAGGGHLLSAMWHAIWTGRYRCDLDQPFRRTTPLAATTVGSSQP